MANEFIVRKGLRSLDNAQITGSLSVGNTVRITSGSLIVQGQTAESGFVDEGIVFRYGTSDSVQNRIRLTSAKNLQFNAEGSFQFNPRNGSVQLLHAKQLRFNAEGNDYNGFNIGATTGSVYGAGRLDFQNKAGTRILTLSGSQVGIGKTDPVHKLDLQGDPLIGFYNADSTYVALIGKGDSTVTDAAATDFGIRTNTGNIVFATNGATEKMRIDTAGNVGIGTSFPDQKLTVKDGNLLVTRSSAAKVEITTHGEGTSRLAQLELRTARAGSNFLMGSSTLRKTGSFTYFDTDEDLFIRPNSKTALRIGGNGDVYFVSGATHPDGSPQNYNDIRFNYLHGNAKHRTVTIGPPTGSGKNALTVTGSLQVDGPFSQLRLRNQVNNKFVELGLSSNDFFIKRGDSSDKIKFRRQDNIDVVTFDMGNQRVGIGTNTPAVTLDVRANAQGDRALEVGHSSQENLIVGTTTGYTRLEIGDGDYHHRFFTRNAAGTEAKQRFVIEGGADEVVSYFQDTNVAIGLTNPNAKLHVSSSGTRGIAIETYGSGQSGPQLFIKGNKQGGRPAITTLIELQGTGSNDHTRARGIKFTSTEKPDIQWYAGTAYGYDAYQIGYDPYGHGRSERNASASLFIENFGSASRVAVGTHRTKAGLTVASTGEYGTQAWFGDPAYFVQDYRYHYDFARVGFTNTNSASDAGAGLMFNTRNTALNNWMHGYIYQPRDGGIALGTGGQGTTSAEERMRITHAGKVGIGTAEPISVLHVSGSGTTSTGAGITIENPGHVAGDAVLQLLIRGERRFVVGIDHSDDRKFKIASSADLASHARFTIDGSTGHIGIGTTKPTRRLTVSGSISASGVYHVNEAIRGNDPDVGKFTSQSRFTTIQSFITDADYEADAFYNPETINFFAGADKWATEVSISNAYIGNRKTLQPNLGPNPFKAGGNVAQLYFTASDAYDSENGIIDVTPDDEEIVITIDHSEHLLRWVSAVGMQFSDPSWTPRRVKIEAEVQNIWTASLDTRDNTNTTVAGYFRPGPSGIKKVRFTLGTPNNEAYVRISKIFAYDYQGVSAATEARSGNYYIEKYVDAAHYSNIYPAVDSTYVLGTSELRYSNIFSDVLNADSLNTQHVTASGDVSASGALFASLSFADAAGDVVMYNSSTGELYFTGSYGGGAALVSAGTNINLTGPSNTVINVDDQLTGLNEVTTSNLLVEDFAQFDGTFLFTGFDFTVQNAAVFSGSNVFGSGSDPSSTTHQFTGSLNVTGSSIVLQDSDIIFTGDPTISTSDNSSLTIEPEGTLFLGNGAQTDVVKIGRMSGDTTAGRTEIYANTGTPAAKFSVSTITFNHPITASSNVFVDGEISSSGTIIAHDLQIGENNDSASAGKLTIYKDTNRQAIIDFPRHSTQNMNDEGYIRHWEETQDTAYMDFKVSDNASTNDQFRFGSSNTGTSGAIRAGIIMDAAGRIRTSGSISAGILGTNPADITATRNISATSGTGSFKEGRFTNKVGIGQTAPTVPLEVIGTIKQKQGSGYSNYIEQTVSEAQLTINANATSAGHKPAIKFAATGTEVARIDGVGNITASGAISASGALFASLSLDSSNFNTVMYDTSTGQFYYTGSYGGGGGVTGDGEWDGTRDGDSQITGSLVISGSGNTELIVQGKITGSGLLISGSGVKNIIKGDSGFRLVSGVENGADGDLQYLDATGTTLQWRTNGDAKFKIRSQNVTPNDTFIHFEHQSPPGPQDVSIGICQDSGSFIIARDEGFAENNDFTITGSNGFIGINQPNPNERLSVVGNITASGDIRSATILKSRFGVSSTGDYSDFAISNNSNGTSGHIRLITNSTERMRITGAGNIGIGTTNPTERLSVVGNISASGDMTASGQIMAVEGFRIPSASIDGTNNKHNFTIQRQGTAGSFDIGHSNSGAHIRLRSSNITDLFQRVDIHRGMNVYDLSDRLLLQVEEDNNTVNIGTNTNDPTSSINIYGATSIEGSGSTVFEVVGSQGQLFSITDQLSGSLFGVSDVSGLPMFEVFSDGNVVLGKYTGGNVSSSYNSTASFGVYYGDGSHLTGVTGDSGVESYGFDLVDSTDVVNIFHSLESEYVSITVYTGSIATNDKRQIIPKEARVISDSQIRLEFDRPTTGDVVIHRGGNIVSGSAFSYRQTLDENQLLGSPHPNYSYDIQHNLNELYPIVQFYTSSADGYPTQMIPRAITSINANQVRLEFDTPMEGTIVVKR